MMVYLTNMYIKLFAAVHYGKNAHFESGTIVIPTHKLPYQQILQLTGYKQIRYHVVPQMEQVKKLLQSQMGRLTYKILEK